MVPKPQDLCGNCSLYAKDPNGFVRPEGTGSLGVLAFGESGGEREYREGLPFRPGADAGSVLERAFKRLGYDRQQWALSNIISCRPNSSPFHHLDHAHLHQVGRRQLVDLLAAIFDGALGDLAAFGLQ